MRTIWKLTALLSVAALALFAAVSAGAGNPHPMYTCTKVKHNGDTVVQFHVPESAIRGLTNAGFTCVAEDETESGDQGDNGDQGDQGDQGNQGGSAASATSEDSQEPRSLYCVVAGKTLPADWNGMGPALNLLDSQGDLLVQMGVVTPARFYAGLGASCDILPGYTYAGYWVDHMGGVVPGVAVYPFYVTG